MRKSCLAIQLLSVCATIILAAAGPAQAGVISTRADLNSALGVAAETEDFENWSSNLLAPYGGFTTLDSNTVVSGQGPGIVNDGISFWVGT